MNKHTKAQTIGFSVLIGLLSASLVPSHAQSGSPVAPPADASIPTLRPPMPSGSTTAPSGSATVQSGSATMSSSTGSDFSSMGLGSATTAPPPPSMDTIIQKVPLTVDKKSVERGPYVGLNVRLHNGTNAPLVFDGNRARVNAAGKQLEVVTDQALEQAAAPPPSIKKDVEITVADAVTIGAVSAIRDYRIERGPILPRYGTDQMRRQVTLERFGARILWPGDETEGTIYVKDGAKPDAITIELPVVTFPALEIRGYISSTK